MINVKANLLRRFLVDIFHFDIKASQLFCRHKCRVNNEMHVHIARVLIVQEEATFFTFLAMLLLNPLSTAKVLKYITTTHTVEHKQFRAALIVF
jgi:hypothetical protein